MPIAYFAAPTPPTTTVKTGIQSSGVSAGDLIIIDLSGGDATQNLPSASSIGGSIEIKATNNANNVLTIDANGSETIDGALTYLLDESNQYVRLQSDGSNWFVTGFFQDVSGPFGGTNLSVSAITSTTIDVVSDTGDNATLPAATTTTAGLMSAADKTSIASSISASSDNTFTGANAFTAQLSVGVLDTNLDNPADGDTFDTFAGWTAETAASAASTAILPGYLRINGTQTNTLYRYHKSTGQAVTDVGASLYQSFDFGPLLFSSGLWTADVVWQFSIHADDGAGEPDFDIYNRAELAWIDPAAGGNRNFYVRHVTYNGTTQNTSSWVALRGDLGIFTAPIFRLNIRNNTDGRCNFYIGTNKLALTQERISQIVTSIAPSTWGDLHYVISRTRGAGVTDYLYIGGVDYNGAVS